MLAGAGLALSGCVSTISGPITTVTIDVAQIVTDASTILGAVSVALLAPPVVLALGTNYAAVKLALQAAQAALLQLEGLTGGSVSVSYSGNVVQALVKTLLDNAQTALGLIQGAAMTLPGKVAGGILTSIEAALALIPVIRSRAGLVGSQATIQAASQVWPT